MLWRGGRGVGRGVGVGVGAGPGPGVRRGRGADRVRGKGLTSRMMTTEAIGVGVKVQQAKVDSSLEAEVDHLLSYLEDHENDSDHERGVSHPIVCKSNDPSLSTFDSLPPSFSFFISTSIES